MISPAPVTWIAAGRAMCIYHVKYLSTALSTTERMHYQFMHASNINCNYIQSYWIRKHWITCFWRVKSVLIYKHVFLSSGCHFLSIWKKREGWRDGRAVSVKEEEEKIKWQGGYEMCVWCLFRLRCFGRRTSQSRLQWRGEMGAVVQKEQEW